MRFQSGFQVGGDPYVKPISFRQAFKNIDISQGRASPTPPLGLPSSAYAVPASARQPSRLLRWLAEPKRRRREGWCPRSDSNRHTSRYRILSAARLPIPPQGPRAAPHSSGGRRRVQRIGARVSPPTGRDLWVQGFSITWLALAPRS